MKLRIVGGAMLAVGLLGTGTIGAAQASPEPTKVKPKAQTSSAPKPVLKAAPRVLEGVVKAPDGKPVEGARVTYQAEEGLFGSLPATMKTDASGRFRAELKTGARLSVRVEAKGFGSRVLESVRPGSPITITLDRGRTLEGTIRDSAGQPVPGARVEARATMAVSMLWDPTVGQASARSDAQGRYRLEGLEPALFTITAALAGVGQASRSNVRPVGRVDLVLGPASGLTGEVVDAAGRPVAGAVVRAEKPPFGEGDADTTDALGRFLMPGLSPGNYHVAAKHPDFAPGLAPEVVVAAASEAQVQLVLDAGTTVVGRVVDAAEHPLAGTVALEQWGDLAATASLAQALRAEAGADGRFRLERVAGGSYVFGVRAPGLGSKSVDVSASGRAGLLDLGDVVLEPGLAIRGHVRTKAGAPVADALVTASLKQPMFGGIPTAEEHSSADGTFVLAGLAPGTYDLTAKSAGFTSGRAQAAAGAEGADLSVDLGGSLTGLVVEEGDRPVEGFHVHAEPQAGSRPRWEDDRQKAVGSSDGRFLIEDLTEGPYSLQVLVPDRAPASVSSARVVAGQTTDLGTIRVPRGGIVRGAVVDATGGAVAGAKVTIDTGTMEMLNWWGLMTAQTDAGGVFEVRGVPTGTVKVRASHPSFAAGEATAEVDPAKAPAELRIVMMQGGRIEGVVHKRDG